MSTKEMKCVLLADRHHNLSEGVRSLLQNQFQAVVTVASENALVESAERMQPDLVVADLALTRGENFGWLRRLLVRCPESRVIVLSSYPEQTVKQAAYEAGAAGFVVKPKISTQLFAAINEVLAGGRYVPPDAARPQRIEREELL